MMGIFVYISIPPRNESMKKGFLYFPSWSLTQAVEDEEERKKFFTQLDSKTYLS